MGVFDVFNISYKDHLKSLEPAKVAAFYRRLAGKIEEIVGQGNSLASILLLHWLDGKGAEKQFDSRFIRDMPQIKNYLINKIRPVFLTEERLHYGKQDWAGIIPRLKRSGKFAKEEPRDPEGNYAMFYEGPSLEPVSLTGFVKIMSRYKEMGKITEQEKREVDLFTSLHKFGINNNAVLTAAPAKVTATVSTGPAKVLNASVYSVRFKSWKCQVKDTYNWNISLGFPVPNPDFHSQAADAVAPDQDVVLINHANAERVEKAGLAMVYEVKSDAWDVTDPSATLQKDIDISKFKG
jgi:hypothetical protein